jgi:AraC-like DNA-binding protein
MPSSAVQTFTDPDDYAAVIRGQQAEVTILGRGQFTAKVTRIDMHRLWMLRLSDNLPRIGHCATISDIMGGRAIVSFRTAPGPPMLWSGSETHPITIMRHSEGESAFQRSAGSFSRASMSLPVEEIALLGATSAGCELTPPKQALTITPAPSAMAKLQRLHAAAGLLAEEAPEIIAHPEAARGLEQALIEAMVDALANREEHDNSWAHGQHAIVMRRFRGVVEESPEEPLYIPEICKAIRVSERTLRMCCQEYLGMGPKRYLLLRRMHMVRQALRQAATDETSVTDIATRYGFWHLGRFAVEYHSLFGESPSTTLHRPHV